MDEWGETMQVWGRLGRMALEAPIDRDTHRTLRAAVLALRESERRRRFPATLHVGTRGSGEISRYDEGDRVPTDDGLRIDIALALLQHAARAGRPLIWLTRPGQLTVHDTDLIWGASVAHAAASVDLPGCGLVIVTPRGWFDPVSDVRRQWRRLRSHRAAA